MTASLIPVSVTDDGGTEHKVWKVSGGWRNKLA
jgi:hypothetical protein